MSFLFNVFTNVKDEPKPKENKHVHQHVTDVKVEIVTAPVVTPEVTPVVEEAPAVLEVNEAVVADSKPAEPRNKRNR